MDLGILQSSVLGNQGASSGAPVSTPAPAPVTPPASDFGSRLQSAVFGGQSPITASTPSPSPKISAPAPISAPKTTGATQDWNGMKIPAAIPTKNLVNYDPATGNKTFSLPDIAGGGAYTEDANGNMVIKDSKSGHSTYGGEPAVKGMQRDDKVSVGIGGENTTPKNIRYVPNATAHVQDQLETSLAQKVKSGQIAPKAAISEELPKKQAIAEDAAQPQGFMAKLKSLASNVGEGLKTGANIIANAPKQIASDINRTIPVSPLNPPRTPAPAQEFKIGAGMTPEGQQQAKAGQAIETTIAHQEANAPSTAANLDFAQGSADILRMLPRGLAETAQGVAQIFNKNAEPVEPTQLGGLSKFIFGDGTLTPLGTQAAEMEQKLKDKGINGGLATALAIAGTTGNTVLNLLPLIGLMGSEANAAFQALAEAATKETGVRITASDLLQISRNDPEGLVNPEVKQAWTDASNKGALAKEIVKTPDGKIIRSGTKDTPLSDMLKKASTKDVFGRAGKDTPFTAKPKDTGTLNVEEEGVKHPPVKQNILSEAKSPAEEKTLVAGENKPTEPLSFGDKLKQAVLAQEPQTEAKVPVAAAATEIPKELQPLAAEAQKYPTAEAFAKSLKDSTWGSYKTIETEIPVKGITGAEPTNAYSIKYEKGKKITEPIEVIYHVDSGELTVLDGNHRLGQAIANGQKTILARVGVLSDELDKNGDLFGNKDELADTERFYKQATASQNSSAPSEAEAHQSLMSEHSHKPIEQLQKEIADHRVQADKDLVQSTPEIKAKQEIIKSKAAEEIKAIETKKQSLEELFKEPKKSESVVLAAGFNPGVDKFISQELKPAAVWTKDAGATVLSYFRLGISNFMEGLDIGAKVARKYGGDTYAEVIKAFHLPEAMEHNFTYVNSKNINQNFSQVESFLNNKYTEKDLENLNLSFGDPATAEGQMLRDQALKELPENLKNPLWNNIRKEASDWAYLMAKEHDIPLNYFDDYFYGVYKGGEAKVQNMLKHWKSTDRWKKEKVFPTPADALAYGLQLKDANPITNIQKEVRAISHRVAMQELKDFFTENLEDVEKSGVSLGVFKEAEMSPKQASATRTINDPVFDGLRFDPVLAKFVNNLLETNQISAKPLSKAMRTIAQVSQKIKFFASVFHLRNELKSLISDQGFGMLDPQGYKDIGKSVTIDKTWQKTPGYVDYLKLGGGHSYSIEAQTLGKRAFNNFLQRANTGNYLGAGTHALIGIAQIPSKITEWMFDSFIPHAKFQKFTMDTAKMQQKLGRPLTDAEKIGVIKLNQNFYGEMNERLFGRRSTLTSLLRLIFSAPGYGEGNFRTALKAGGFNQDILGKLLNRQTFTNPKIALRDTYRSYKNEGGAKSARFAVSSLITTLITATVGTYIFTHKMPKLPKSGNAVRDLFKIQTNIKDGDNNNIYFDMMSYEKDYWSIYGNLIFGKPGEILPGLKTRLGGGISGMMNVLTDLTTVIENKMIYDYKGTPIFNQTDSFSQKVQKFIKAEMGTLTPISLNTFTTAKQKSGNVFGSILLSYFGITSTTSENAKDIKAFRTDLFALRDSRDKIAIDLGKLYKENPSEAIKEQKAFDADQTQKLWSMLKQRGAQADWNVLAKRLLIGDLGAKKVKATTQKSPAGLSATDVIKQVLGK